MQYPYNTCLSFDCSRFPESKLAKMFNGNIPIILDSLKQHYFIDRDGKMFRYILNFLRLSKLMLPHDFQEIDALLEEARFFDIAPLVRSLEEIKTGREIKKEKDPDVGTNDVTGSSAAAILRGVNQEDLCDCVAVNISPDLGERISLSAERSLLDELFPELNSAFMDSRNAGWNLDSKFVIRFPLNGYCKLNSLQVMQRLLGHGFKVVASTGGGVEGQQFSEYLFFRKRDER